MSELAAHFEKRYRGGATIAADINHPANRFCVLVLFGPSGSGKTTILRCLAGLETPTSGTVRFGNEAWFDSQARVNLRPQQRGVGYLFQQYALFPHLTVRQNVDFAVRRDGKDAARRTDEMLHRFELTQIESRLPGQISGGQQQRVALARTLACRPRLLLLDEPLSSLDQGLREEVRGQLRTWLSEFGVPTIVVTHDRVDAIALGERIAVLSDGRILQQGPIQDVFSSPADRTVAEIVGVETIVEGRVVQGNDELICLDVHGVNLWAPARHVGGERALVCIRGEDVAFSREAEGTATYRNRLKGTIRAVTPEGPLVRLQIDCGFPLTALITKPACVELGLKPGDNGLALIKATAIHVMPI
jgi:molybdate transport system ATP-binding protein